MGVLKHPLSLGLVLNCDRFTVKNALQNTQNDCQQWLSNSSRVHQILFRPGLRPGPRWGSLQRSPRPSSWINGASWWRCCLGHSKNFCDDDDDDDDDFYGKERERNGKRGEGTDGKR